MTSKFEGVARFVPSSPVRIAPLNPEFRCRRIGIGSWLLILVTSLGSAAQAPLAPLHSVSVERSVPYVTRGDRSLLADIYRPKGTRGKIPAVLMIHGGAWFSGNKVHVTPHARFLAEHGYLVAAINYRLAPRDPFPAQVEDCRSALAWLGSGQVAGVDRDRIALYGYSAGAHLACLLAASLDPPLETENENDAETRPTVCAVVAGGAPCEFSWIPPESTRLAFWLGGSPTECPEAYRAASPIEHVDAQTPPIFFFHGDRDGVVPLASPRQMLSRLQQFQVPASLHVVEGGDHLSTFLAESPRHAAVSFLDRILKSKTIERPGAPSDH